MRVKYYPDNEKVVEAVKDDDPLLMLISYDGSTVLVSNIDDSFEHHILLRLMNYKDSDINKYFRVVVNKSGCDWTFVCPSDYKGIKDKVTRIKHFYNDGITLISKALNAIDYDCEINIPDRYRRHFNMLRGDYYFE